MLSSSFRKIVKIEVNYGQALSDWYGTLMKAKGTHGSLTGHRCRMWSHGVVRGARPPYGPYTSFYRLFMIYEPRDEPLQDT